MRRLGEFCAYLFAGLIAVALAVTLETAPYYVDNPAQMPTPRSQSEGGPQL